ncbi:hypothetical protein COH31_10125 [Neisseria meningitidis]|nr:hypothetical protein COH31_10125 [Neisseria meningitidis]
MKRKPYSNCLLLLFQDFFQRFGINQMYSGLTKIRTRRRSRRQYRTDSLGASAPERIVLFELKRGNAVLVFVNPLYLELVLLFA